MLRHDKPSLERIAKRLLEMETLDEKTFQGMLNGTNTAFNRRFNMDIIKWDPFKELTVD
ncbi:MAG TPA: hypothetical protein VMC79_04150 [Rectinemataceae bacterium]|nr:hypothetical protein [Rectinemataceae bacterium]